jgi:ABC-type glycerol-3-phosphate transport system substrate-binding protein
MVKLNGAKSHLDFVFFAYGRRYGDYELDAQCNVIPFFEHESFIPGMTYIKDLWDNGLLDTEFMLNDPGMKDQKFFRGQAGMMYGALFRHVSRIERGVQAMYPNAKLVFGPLPKGPAGYSGNTGAGKSGTYTSITKASKVPGKSAEFLNFMLSKEGFDLLTLGIDGIHFTRQNDKILMQMEERSKDAFADNGWAHPLTWGSFYWPIDTMYLPETEALRDRALESSQLATVELKPNLINWRTAEEIKYQGIVNDIYQQHFLNMLTGKIGIQAGVDALSKEWRSQGGNEILASVTKVLQSQARK